MKRVSIIGKNILFLGCLLLLAGRNSLGAELPGRKPPGEGPGMLLVAARDLAQSGLAKVTFNEAANQVILVRENVRLEITLGSKNARLNGVPVQLPARVEIVKGRAMLPARFVLEILGLPRAKIKMPPAPAPTPADLPGKIQGRVLYNGRPLAGITLRLVHAGDFSFLPKVRAITDTDGNYAFAAVPDGAYRVYAYVGDNPDYFNRATPAVRVGPRPIRVDDINMGRVLAALEPPRGAILSPNRDLVFTWSDCPQAAAYHISVVDPETNEEVLSAETAVSHITLPIPRFSPGRLYQWHITATDVRGEFLGGSPGAGAEAFTFKVAID
jgi:hypothetical protein